MKTLLILTVLLLSELTFSQTVIKGWVLDYYDKTPLSNVKISSNSGVMSDFNGQFEINAEKNPKISFSIAGYIDLIFLCPNKLDTLVCDFYMIAIEPYKPCVADGFIKHVFWKEPICSNYHRKMDKIWIKKRSIDNYTPLNWRLDCLENHKFIENQGGMIMLYQMVFNKSFCDYRKYSESAENDYIYCEIKD
jgi:hypothetical protein